MNKYLKLVVCLVIVTGCNGQNDKKVTGSDSIKKQPVKKEYIKYPKNYKLEISSSGQTDTTYILGFSYRRINNSFPINFNSGFMIHKNGTKWWFNHAQKKYKEIVFGKNYGYSNTPINLMTKDSILLKDFDKWIFIVDKKYIQEYPPIADGDNPDTWDYPNYDIKENTEFKAKLYKQKNNTDYWVKIEERTFKSGPNGEVKEYYKWKNDFGQEKIKEDIDKISKK